MSLDARIELRLDIQRACLCCIDYKSHFPNKHHVGEFTCINNQVKLNFEYINSIQLYHLKNHVGANNKIAVCKYS